MFAVVLETAELLFVGDCLVALFDAFTQIHRDFSSDKKCVEGVFCVSAHLFVNILAVRFTFASVKFTDAKTAITSSFVSSEKLTCCKIAFTSNRWYVFSCVFVFHGVMHMSQEFHALNLMGDSSVKRHQHAWRVTS